MTTPFLGVCDSLWQVSDRVTTIWVSKYDKILRQWTKRVLSDKNQQNWLCVWLAKTDYSCWILGTITNKDMCVQCVVGQCVLMLNELYSWRNILSESSSCRSSIFWTISEFTISMNSCCIFLSFIKEPWWEIPLVISWRRVRTLSSYLCL